MSLVSLFRALVLLTLLGLSIAVYTGVEIRQLQSRQQSLANDRQQAVSQLQLVRAEILAARQLVAKYVVSGDAQSLITYYELLAMHTGNRRYANTIGPSAWSDFVAGNSDSPIRMLDETGPTVDERVSVNFAGTSTESKKISELNQALFSQEQIIFALTQGLYDPISDTFVSEAEKHPDIALQRLNSPQYQQLVSSAYSVIDRQLSNTDQVFQTQLQALSAQITQFANVSLYSLVVLAVMLIAALIGLLKYVVGPIRQLDTLSREVEAGRYDAPIPKAYFLTEIVNLVKGITLMIGSFGRELTIQEAKLNAERQATDAKIAKEKAEAEVTARGDLLANMSHEIRTPMNAIIGMTNLVLRANELSPKSRSQLEKALSAARSLLQLLNDILDFSKAESNMVELEQTSFRLDEVVSNSFLAVQTEANRKNLPLLYRLSGDNAYAISQRLIGDPLRIRQVLTNLLSNAVKFTEQGHIQLNVQLALNSNSTATLFIEVSDTGLGMTDKECQAVFEQYQQANKGTSRRHGGTGLGLSITKKLVSLMGGQINVCSAPGIGSTFALDIPLLVSQQHEPYKAPIEKALIIGEEGVAETCILSTLKSAGIHSKIINPQQAPLVLDECDLSLEVVILTKPEAVLHDKKLITALQNWLDNYVGQAFVVLNGTDYTLAETEANPYINALPEDCTFLTNPILIDDIVNAGRDILPQLDSVNQANAYVEACKSKLTGLHLLVLEDHPVNQQLIVQQLENVGISVTLVPDGEQGLTALKTHPDAFDGILSDLEMPKVDGYQFGEAVRANSDYADTPMVALTGHGFTEVRQRCLRIGFNEVLTKPLEETALYDCLMVQFSGKVKPNKPRPTPNSSGQPGVPTIAATNLTTLFLKHCDNVPSKLRALQAEGKSEDLTREFHSLISALAVINETELSDSMRRLERGLKIGLTQEEEAINEIEQIWPNLLQRLRDQTELP